MYDPASNSWRAIAPMGSKRSPLAAAVVGGLLYALGGGGDSGFSSCEVYDPASNSWRAIAPMGSKRRYLAAAVVGGLLYALGGYDGSGALSSCGCTILRPTAGARSHRWAASVRSGRRSGQHWLDEWICVDRWVTGAVRGGGLVTLWALLY